jgi:hypothetical protein
MLHNCIKRVAHTRAAAGKDVALNSIKGLLLVFRRSQRGWDNYFCPLVKGHDHKSDAGIQGLHNFQRALARGPHFRAVHRAGAIQGDAQGQRGRSQLEVLVDAQRKDSL